MIRILLVMAALFVGPPAIAQEDDDRSRLVRLLEGALSNGAGGQVRIDGFAGALSSTATLDSLTVSDDDGVWLSIENAELSWTRAALLRGALEVDRLAAERITLTRIPPSTASAPDPETTPFQLPELPVSISLGALDIERIELGAAILGQAVVAQAFGIAELADGDGAAEFSLTRLDGPRGSFDLTADYSNETNILNFVLHLNEAADGLAATLLSIPGTPALDLSFSGQGPLDDFAAELEVASDGAPRLIGDIVIARPEDAPEDIRLFADISGDLAVLLAPEYRDFFGENISLRAEAFAHGDGRVTIPDFALETAELQLEGSAEIDAEGRPERFLVIGQIAAEDGGPVRLPISGSPVTVSRMGLVVGHDRAQSNALRAGIELDALVTEDLQLAEGRFDLQGEITLPGETSLAIGADVVAGLRGLALQNADLQTAIGPEADLTLRLDWQDGAPFVIRDFLVRAGNAELSGDADITLADSQIDIVTTLAGGISDLAPYSGLAGQDLGGAAQVEMALEAELLSGAFDADISLIGQNLTAGDTIPEALLAGQSTVEISANRGTEGLVLERLTIETAQLSGAASGRLSSGRSQLDAEARLADVSLFTDALSGPVSTELTLSRATETDPWQITMSAQAVGGVTADIAGTVGHADGSVNLNIDGAIPLALADPFIAPQSVRGTAQFDLSLNGAPGLGALAGTIRAADTRILLPDTGIGLSGVDVSVNLAGGVAALNGSGRVDAGGRFDLTGDINLASASYPGQIALTLNNVIITEGSLLQTEIERADITIAGAMAAGPAISGEVVLGTTELQLEGTSTGSAEPIPEITHIGQSNGQYLTRLRAGLIDTGQGASIALPLDLIIRAPQQIFIRGRGLDAELGGQIQIGGTTAAIIPAGQFELIRGRLSLLGQRFDLSEATATLRGSFDPYLRIAADTEAGDALITILLEGLASAPELSFVSNPSMPQDEILALLLFGRDTNSLSAVQAIQLVDAVTGFAGGGGLITGLRNRLGVDDLDLTTDDEGNAELRVGRYISENIYTDVELGSNGDAEVSINIDLTSDILGRGSVDSDGNGSLGIFFERDY